MHNKKKSKLTISLIIIIILLIISGGFFGYKYYNTVHNDPARQAQNLVNKIGKHISLPAEQPTVATIVDKNKLSNQTLRDRAENDDKLFIYSKAKRIILYRPSTDKVVEMLTIQDQAVQPAGTKTTK